MSKKSTLSLPLIILLLGFPHISETIYTPALPLITLDLNTTAHLTELTLSVYFVGFAIGVGFWGFYCDVLGRRPAMLAGLLFYVAACIALWFSQSIESILCWRFFQALGASAGSVVTQTMLRDLYEGKQRHQIFATVGGALAFTPAIGPWLGGYLCMYFGWKSNFMVLTLLGTLLFIYCVIFLKETRIKKSESIFQLKNVSKVASKLFLDVQLWKHVLLISICNGMVFGFYGEGSFLFIELMHFTPVQFGLLGLGLCGAGLLASFISRRLVTLISPHSIINLGSYCTLVGALILSISVYLGFFNNEVSMSQMIIIMTGICTCFLGIAMIISNSLSIALEQYKETLGIAGAIFGGMYYMGIALLMGLISLLHNGTVYTMPLMFLACSICLLLCCKMKVGVQAETVLLP